MSNPWQLYDNLIDLIPTDLRVTHAHLGEWAYVDTDAGAGAAMVYHAGPREGTDVRDIVGKPLRDVAALSKSWDLEVAALGVAALGSYLTTAERVDAYGSVDKPGQSSTFELHAEKFAQQKTAAIGHFGDITKYAEGNDFVVLERLPSGDDLPDAACEYVLADRDEVYITGSTLVNKTLPRLLELCADARVVLVGPSAVFAPEVWPECVAEIGGSIVVDREHVRRAVRTLGGMREARAGLRQFNTLIRGESQ